MGMFNWVKFEAPCKKCGNILNGFQTKDCEDELFCETVEPKTCENFYDNCDNCDTWNEYEVINKKFVLKNND